MIKFYLNEIELHTVTTSHGYNFTLLQLHTVTTSQCYLWQVLLVSFLVEPRQSQSVKYTMYAYDSKIESQKGK